MSPRTVSTVLGMAAAVAFAAVVVSWLLTGGRWFVVETPSMGTSAPVGTLLWVHPVQAQDLHVGELVTFRPPGSPETYSHRIYAISPDGAITTKGQITPVDPWQLHASDIVGRVSARWWGVGWLVTSAPILALGGLLLALACRLTSRRWRQPVLTAGASLVVAVAVVVYRPLTGAVTLASAGLQNGGGRASYVSTGLLPLKLQAPGSPSVHLSSGQTGTIVSHHVESSGKYALSLSPDVPWWWWAVLVACCFVPALCQSLRHRRVSVPKVALG